MPQPVKDFFQCNFKIFFPGMFRKAVGVMNVFNELIQLKRLVLDSQFSGLNGGQIKNIVDDSLEVSGRGFNCIEIFDLMGIEGRSKGDLGHAQNGIERGSHLMA
jgi:hypothetical protein